MTDEAIRAELRGLQKSVDDGFGRMDKRLGAIEIDVKELREESLPRRVGKLEKWRDRISSRSWAIFGGSLVAILGAWSTVLFK